MNKILSFVTAFLTGLVLVLAVVALISPRLAWAKLRGLGVGLVRDWRVRISVLSTAIVTLPLLLVSPYFGLIAAVAGHAYTLWGIKPRKAGKIEVVIGDAVDEVIQVLENTVNGEPSELKVSVTEFFQALGRRFGFAKTNKGKKAEQASKPEKVDPKDVEVS